MTISFAEYQKQALRTAQPEAFSDVYLIPMIVGETGELIGQIAKARWHGIGQDKLNRKLMLELGDVAWGLAIYLHTRGVTPDEVIPVSRSTNRWAAYGMLESHSHGLFNRWVYKEPASHVASKAAQMWNFIQLFSYDLTGYEFDEVLGHNLGKLASRAARGTLRGNGDDR